MENCLTSTPLYERIIIDRGESKVMGFTFENISDNQYQETYTYQQDPNDASQTIYNAYLYKPPGYKKWIRQKAHNWGVSTMEEIIIKQIKAKDTLLKCPKIALEKVHTVQTKIGEKTKELPLSKFGIKKD